MEYIIPAAKAQIQAAMTEIEKAKNDLSDVQIIKQRRAYEKTLFRLRRKWLKYFLVLVIKRKILLSR